MRLRWSRTADSELRRLHAYIASENPTMASATIRRLRAATTRLRDFPNLGAEIGDLGEYPVRHLVVGIHEIWYEVQPTAVVILRVWDTRQQRSLGDAGAG